MVKCKSSKKSDKLNLGRLWPYSGNIRLLWIAKEKHSSLSVQSVCDEEKKCFITLINIVFVFKQSKYYHYWMSDRR
jgi:hypothetical protein